MSAHHQSPLKDSAQERENLRSILAFAALQLEEGKGWIDTAFCRFGALILAAFLGSGCSTVNFAYTAAPTALSFMADGYLDLDSEQASVLKDRLIATREWLRTTQMAAFSRFLAEVSARTTGTVNVEDVAWAVAEARKRWNVVAERLAAEIADLAPLLGPENLAAVRKKQAKSNAEYLKDFAGQSPDKRLRRRVGRIREEAERWYGDLDDAQMERIRVLVAAIPANYPLVIEDRRRRQAEFAGALGAAAEKGADKEAVRRRFTQLLTSWDNGRTPAYQAFAAQYQAQSHRLTVEIVNMATPAQRETLKRRAQRWVDDLAALATHKEP